MYDPKLYDRITQFVQKHQLITPDSTIILGLSGGPDSVFLFHYLMSVRETLQFNMSIAHLNHGWRAESDHDEAFCRELAHQFGIPFFARHARSLEGTISWTGSREEQARVMRRLFFEELVGGHPHASIALAHHLDDQYETFFIRLMRGAGLQGLRGMVPNSECYIRPLLCVHKEEILEYLRVHQITFVIDSTNQEVTYLRNRIRHQIIPALRTCDERFINSFHQTMLNLNEADDFCTEVATKTLQSLTTEKNGELWLDISELLTLRPFLQKQIIMRWLCTARVPFIPSQGFYQEILRFLQQPQGGTHQLNKKWKLYKSQKQVTIRTH